jgi:copper homeostasis protein
MSKRVKVEICVGDLTSALEAEAGGADRVELCDNLAVGGTTPSPGTIAEACRRLSVPVHVLIRPRGGDFIYSEPEVAAMLVDITFCKSHGAAAVVLGALDAEGAIDREITKSLVARARPMSVTFHKAFDQTRDSLAALDTLKELSVERVLTSGARPTALEGVDLLSKLVTRSGGQIEILAGGRIRLEDIEPIVRQGYVRELHFGSAASQRIESAMRRTPDDGSETACIQTNRARVASIVARVRPL